MEPKQINPNRESIEYKSPFKMQSTEILSVKERVDELSRNLMTCYTIDNFTRGLADYNWPPIPIKGLEAREITLFNFIRANPNAPNIWDLVFKKLDLPSSTIPFGHGLSVTLPSELWEYHSKTLLKDVSSECKDIAPGDIQTFIQCLQACNSLNLLTEENWLKIMKLAKKHSIIWLFYECLQFGLLPQDRYFRMDLSNLKFKEMQELIPKLISKSAKIYSHLSELIPLLFSSKIHNEECTFSFSHGQKVRLPLYIWKEHSDFFWNMANFNKAESYNLQDDEVSQKSIEAFVHCLTYCTSHNVINLENYVELAGLANKYQIAWLQDDCEEFFKVYTLSQAAQCQFIKITKDYIVELIRNKTPSKVKDALDKLADQYRLLALKLYAHEFSLDILPDNTLLIKMPHDSTLLQTCLAMENPWDAPKIELHCYNSCSDFDEKDFELFSKIIERTKCPITIRLDYHTPPEGPRISLSEMLNKYPNIKNLKIVISMEDSIESILEMIKKNKTLESLQIVIHDCHYLKNAEKNFSVRNLNVALQKALDENKHIKKIPILYAEYVLDSTRTYIKGDPDATEEGEVLFNNYEITAQKIELRDWPLYMRTK